MSLPASLLDECFRTGDIQLDFFSQLPSYVRRKLLILALAFSYALPVSGQNLGDIERSRYSPASYYNYSEPADVTMIVNIWGTVRNPGLYEIPQGTTLSHLLSLAGGPIVSPRENRQKRTIQVRLFRPGGPTREPLFEAEMENEVVAAIEDPTILQGDIVTVETVIQRRFSWRDAFPIIAAVGTIAIAIERMASTQ